MGKIIMVASGKGGAGKSTVTSGLAVSLARHRRLTCVVDADVGLRGIDLMLGLQDKAVFDLFDVARGDCDIDQALICHERYKELYLLTTSQAEAPDALSMDILRDVTSALRKRFDYVLIDCPAGIGDVVLRCAACADMCVLVATPDDLSLRDAERAAALLREQGELPLYLAVNRADRRLISEGALMAPGAVADYIGIPLIGEVPREDKIYRALLGHASPAECGSREVSLSLERMALRVEGGEAPYINYRVRRKPWYRNTK